METAEHPPVGRNEPGMKEAAAAYLAARVDLLRIEAGEAARHAVRRGILAGTLAAFATFAWALVLAGLVGLLADRLQQAGYDIPWHLVAIALGVVHLLVAIILGIIVSRPAPQAFETTRVELEKDRAWLADLRNQISSKR